MFRRCSSSLLAGLALSMTGALLSAPAAAAFGAPAPHWTVTAISVPTNLAPTAGSTGFYRVIVQNTGGSASNGEVTITDRLPKGLKATGSASGEDERSRAIRVNCTGTTCTYAGSIVAQDLLHIIVPFEVEAEAPASVTNVVSVSGGGAPEVTRETPTAITSTPASFGLAPGGEAVSLSTLQAGAHPDVTVNLAFTSKAGDLLTGDPKETVGELPPGFAGDLADTPKCPIAIFSLQEEGAEGSPCPAGSQVGTAVVQLKFFGEEPGYERVPVYNVTTNPGEIARLAFFTILIGNEGTISLRPGDYGIRTTFNNIFAGISGFDGISLTIWGVPAESANNPLRERLEESNIPSTSPPIPYLTSPTECTTEPLEATLKTASWQEPNHQVSMHEGIGPLTGCNLLGFPVAIAAAPDTVHADTPAGFTFAVKMVQEGLVSAEGTAAADIENTTVTLPEGVGINPGQANGLGACQESQAELDKEAPPTCPSNSKVGQIEIETPILRSNLYGNVYVMQSNPPDLKLLVAPEDPPDGIFVKFIGIVHLNEKTGQLVTTFEHTPQLPFSSLKFSFSGGAQAALVTPTQCGIYASSGLFAPWSAEADKLVESSFAIEDGAGPGACPPSPLPYTPQMIAGSTTDQAGGYTSFSLLLTRPDDQQRTTRLQFKTPEGLLGMISRVPLCTNAQVEADSCPEASKIGHTVVESGPGPYPLVVPEPTKPPAPIYLTEGYDGAPYGLLIVVPLEVGPFLLPTQLVRAKIEVDPLTTQLTVTTNEFPQYVAGVPTDLRTINAVIDRHEFMFNPTGCEAQSFSGTAYGTEGAAVPISSHFQMGSCRSLTFKPNFQVSTSGHTSRNEGASLTAKILYPAGVLGANQASSQSNIGYVKVELPKQLPSRLSTLQKACTSATFNANPANCPAASRIGEAKAVTPVLPVPLTGPAYFVSNGSAKFPELIVVLQGYGVTVDLHGETFISKAGITSTTFPSVPDVPIYSFELNLPEGPDSALAANGNLCTSKLTMPTRFVGHNNAEVHQSTSITVTGCSKTLKVVRHKKTRKGKKASITVQVPSAGTLTVSATGISTARVHTKKAGRVTVPLMLTGQELAVLARHQGRKLAAHVDLTFVSRHGARITNDAMVIVG